MRMRDLLRAAKRRCRERRCSCRVLRTQGTSEQVPRGARWREMRMNARRTKPSVQRRLMRAQRALSREAAAVATKVVVRTTTEEAGAAGAAFSRQPFGTGLAGALALSRGSHTNPRFALLRAIIPSKLPVAPARDLFRWYGRPPGNGPSCGGGRWILTATASMCQSGDGLSTT